MLIGGSEPGPRLRYCDDRITRRLVGKFVPLLITVFSRLFSYCREGASGCSRHCFSHRHVSCCSRRFRGLVPQCSLAFRRVEGEACSWPDRSFVCAFRLRCVLFAPIVSLRSQRFAVGGVFEWFACVIPSSCRGFSSHDDKVAKGCDALYERELLEFWRFWILKDCTSAETEESLRQTGGGPWVTLTRLSAWLGVIVFVRRLCQFLRSFLSHLRAFSVFVFRPT